MAFDFLRDGNYFYAPLKYVSGIMQRIEHAHNDIFGVLTAAPYQYNAVTWANYGNSRRADLASSEYDITRISNYSGTTPMGLWGYAPEKDYSAFYAYKTFPENDDSVILFEYTTLREFINAQFGDLGGAIVHSDVRTVLGMRYHKDLALKTAGGLTTSNYLAEFVGDIVPITKQDDDTYIYSATADYDDWLVVTNIYVYSRENGSTAARTQTSKTLVYSVLASGATFAYSEYKDEIKTSQLPAKKINKSFEWLLQFNLLNNLKCNLVSYGGSASGKAAAFTRAYASLWNREFEPISGETPGASLSSFLRLGAGGYFDLTNAVPINTPTNTDDRHFWDTDISNCPYSAPLNLPFKHVKVTRRENGGMVVSYDDTKALFYTDGGGLYAPAYSAQYLDCAIFETEDDIKRWFSDFGVPSTSDPETAKTADRESIDTFFPEEDGQEEIPNPGDNTPIGAIPYNPQTIIDDFPEHVPNISTASFFRTYALTLPELQAVFGWFMDSSYLDNISELFADKLTAVYGALLLPFDLLSHDPAHIAASSGVSVANVTNADLGGHVLLAGYNTNISGGELYYVPYYGNYNDWTECDYSLYIPYAGIHDIPASAVINKKLTITYAVDLMTGNANAVIKSYDVNNGITAGALVKTVPAQIGIKIPVISSNYGQIEIQNALSTISLFGSLAGSAANIAGNLSSGNFAGAAMGAVNAGLNISNNIATSQFKQQTKYSASGGISATTGLCMPQKAFLCIRRGNVVNAAGYKQLNGLPTLYGSTIGGLSGFVKVQNAFINAPSATSTEIGEITNLLKSGIYV